MNRDRDPGPESAPHLVDVTSAPLWSPSLAVLRDALEEGLERNYRDVGVHVTACPDLREIGCAWQGLGGAPALVDIGGEPYAHNPRYRDVRFDTEDILRRAGHPGPQVLGAGMGCTGILRGHCGEVITNHQMGSTPASRAARVDGAGRCRVEPYRSGRFAGLANLYVSRGEPGPVLEVEVAHRTGEQGSFPLAMRDALAPLTAGNGREIGLGGVFRVEGGGIRSHVVPDYDRVGHEYYDVERELIVAEFLRFFQPVGPGLLCFSVLWTGDPTGGALDLRPASEHTHFYHPDDDTMGGHYHDDVTPETIHCRGWFAPAERLWRVANIYARLRATREDGRAAPFEAAEPVVATGPPNVSN